MALDIFRFAVMQNNTSLLCNYRLISFRSICYFSALSMPITGWFFSFTHSIFIGILCSRHALIFKHRVDNGTCLPSLMLDVLYRSYRVRQYLHMATGDMYHFTAWHATRKKRTLFSNLHNFGKFSNTSHMDTFQCVSYLHLSLQLAELKRGAVGTCVLVPTGNFPTLSN